ncbi:oligopeptide/dipeptide ABC transporter, permease protein [Salipiger mucosus DSM 16094]|uniref:Oligopeptide/dipeptide ABC transporter, permease protein n=2 Tax=Salipiger mucosus TaxID=263378 RepID=S9S4K7_9RHOB|nr:oligopeptide/dipeptide ABC transporter, permease protein [Salipiger mucosus DSM 16094]
MTADATDPRHETQTAAEAPPRLRDRVVGLARLSPTGAAGLALIVLFALLALFSGVLMPHDPVASYTDRILQPPSAEHWFGTDGNGMDVFSRVIYGARFGFGIAIPAVLLSVVIGVPVGLIAGYRGGYLDEVLMRFFDGLRVFPSIILALAVVAATGQSLFNVILVLGLLDSPVFARVVRAEVLSLRASVFVEGAVAAGNPTWRILFVHILPNAIQGALAQVAVRAAWAVRISATLAFLGVGIQAPTPEWGAMIRQGAEFMVTGQWWVGVFPGTALILMVFGLNLLGDGLQDVMDPRRRAAK